MSASRQAALGAGVTGGTLEPRSGGAGGGVERPSTTLAEPQRRLASSSFVPFMAFLLPSWCLACAVMILAA